MVKNTLYLTKGGGDLPLKTQTMKSLCKSAPFWKTVSGIMTVGLPDAEMVAGAILFRVLSSNLRIFSTRVGLGGRGRGLTEV